MPASASAQSGLEARRDALFAQMLRAPADLDLMLGYARLSVEARDYEQVVATLERVLATAPEAVEARLELAVAYYALGAYELAKYHLDIVATAPDLPDEVAREVARYSTLAEERAGSSSVTGYVEAGPAYGLVEDEAGVEFGFGLVWRVQPEGAQDLRWITELNGRILHFPGADELSFGAFLFRTGPDFSLDGRAYGLRMRPYLAAASSVDIDLDQRSTLGAGALLTNTFSQTVSGFLSLEGGGLWRDDPDTAGTYGVARIGLNFYPARDTLIRAALRGRRDETGEDFYDIDGYGMRLDVRYGFKPDFSRSDRKWQLSGYVLRDWQDYYSLDPDTTADVWGFGAALRAYVRGDYYVELRGDRVDRNSDLESLETERALVGVLFGREF